MPVGQLRPLRNRAEGNAHPNANGDRLGRSGSVGSATRRAAENRLPLRPSRPRRRRWSRVAASELLRVPQTAPRAVHLLRERGQPPYRSDRSTRSRRYAAISNLRVSELTGLRIDDVALPSMSIRVHGKGRRDRALPLWKTTATALRAWLVARGVIAVPEVFVNVRGKPLSRWGFAYLLKQHAEAASQRCPQLLNKQVSPHVLRHTSAMIVLHATQDIRKVSLWLGHSNLATTEIYTRGDPSEKLEAIEAIVPPHLRKGFLRPPDKLIALLRDKS